MNANDLVKQFNIKKNTLDSYIAVSVANTLIYLEKGKDNEYWQNDRRQRELHYDLMVEAGFNPDGSDAEKLPDDGHSILDYIAKKREFDKAIQELVTQEYIREKRKLRIVG